MDAAPFARKIRGTAIATAAIIAIASIDSAAVAADGHSITVSCDC
jgi:hypothetical protein